MKPIKLGFLIAIGLGAWYFFTHFRIVGLENVTIAPRGKASAGGVSLAGASRQGSGLRQRALRIGAANFGPLDSAKLAKPHVANRVVQLLRQFDLVALQDIQAANPGLLVRLVEQLNAAGQHYDYAVAPQVGRDPVRQFHAFVFDTDALEIDRRTVASVAARGGGFRHPPLVAAFRARGPAPHEAFTFTLLSVQVSSERTNEELELLAQAYRAVRDDGRNEDDILIAGTLNTDEEHLGPLAALPRMTCAIVGTPTVVGGTGRVDNIVFDRWATCEFTHRSGVVDVVRQFNLSFAEAAEITAHLPVWAEFSTYEGGQPGLVPSPP